MKNMDCKYCEDEFISTIYFDSTSKTMAPCPKCEDRVKETVWMIPACLGMSTQKIPFAKNSGTYTLIGNS
jgi:hypothetical protein